MTIKSSIQGLEIAFDPDELKEIPMISFNGSSLKLNRVAFLMLERALLMTRKIMEVDLGKVGGKILFDFQVRID